MIRCFVWQSFVGNPFHIIASSAWMSCQLDSSVQRFRGFLPRPKRIDSNGTKSMSWVVHFMNKYSHTSPGFQFAHLPFHSTYIDIWYDLDRYLCAWSIFHLPYHILQCLPQSASPGT